MGKDLTDHVLSVNTDVMDHSRELVAYVYKAAPDAYNRLITSPRIIRAIEESNRFNYGKVFAFAEYVVFRREFTNRFPDASPKACINAFCSLFLKNDISMTNLVNFMEGSSDEELLLLRNKPDN